MNTRNVYLYWVGKEYKLIKILRNLIYLHSTNGIGYTVHLITDKNVNEYVEEVPVFFNKMQPAHQADFVRVCVLCDRGGIWLDSDTIVIESLDILFDLLDTYDGFFINENNKSVCTGVFGSNPGTNVMLQWKNKVLETLKCKQEKISWLDIGSWVHESYINKEYYTNYKIFNGLDNVYPVNWDRCELEFIKKPYDNYKNLIRSYQPLVVLVHSVYHALETKSEREILEGRLPLNYFINKSFENAKLIDYDFIEIGTSNFDTLIQSADDNTRGLSVDIIKQYLDDLPNRQNVKKINCGVSNVNTVSEIYYIPQEIIYKNKLPKWFAGCNCINTYHPLHISHNVSHLCKIEKVNVITTEKLFYTNKVRGVKYLKIDTEGHDCIILKVLYDYIKFLPTPFYPTKILFETNEHADKDKVDELIKLFCLLGYVLKSRGYDTVLAIECH